MWCSFPDPRCFLLVTVYGTTHAHLVHICWPLLWGLHQMGRNFATFGTYALLGSFKWIMRVLNSQGSRLWRLHHPSPESPDITPIALLPQTTAQPTQQFKVCYSRTQKFFTVPLDPNNIRVT